MPYVNGSLFSLLSHNQFCQEAKEIGLDQNLEETHNTGDPETRKQVQYLLNLLESHQSNSSISSCSTSVGDVSSTNEDISTISDDDDDESIVRYVNFTLHNL